MDMISTKSREKFSRAVFQGAAWNYAVFISGKLIVFISTAVLARLLTKDDFGVVAFALTSMAFLDVFSQMGIGPALIYQAEDELTSSTAFWLNLIARILLFGCAWFLAPLIALYFQDERATSIIRAMSLAFVIQAIGTIHSVLLRKKLAFGKTFRPEFFSQIAKGLVSILLALKGLGVWSLVYGQLASEVVSSLMYWFSFPWKPRLEFALSRARSLLDYGYRYVGSDLIAILILNLDYLLVGRYLGAEALGVYTIAFRLPDLIILQFARTISGVTFPVYSRMREVSDNLAQGFLTTTRYISLITVPLGLGMVLIAHPFTAAVFTEKWADVAPALQGIAIYSMLLSFAYNAGGVYKAIGRPQIIMWVGLIRLSLLFPALWWAVRSAQSITVVSWMQALIAFISAILSLSIAARIFGLSLRTLVQALYPSVMAGAVMAVAVLIVHFLVADYSPWVQLLLSVLVGALAYGIGLWFLQREVIHETLRRVRQISEVKS